MKIEEQERERWKALLRGVMFFKEFDDEDLLKLVEAGEVDRRDLHEYVIKEGDMDNSFFVILKGKVKIIKQLSFKRKKDLLLLTEGDCFGEMGLLLKSPRTASVLTASECFIFKIAASEVGSLPASSKEKFYRGVATSLADKLRSTTDIAVNPHFI